MAKKKSYRIDKNMRRYSLGGGGGRSMGGGGVVKTFQRAVRAGVGGARPNSTANIGGAKSGNSKNLNNNNSNKAATSPTTALTLSSSSSVPFPSLLNLPRSAASAPSWASSSSTEESEWECVDVVDDETAARGFYEDYLFGTVPSSEEVHHAVYALQQALGSSSYISPEAKLAEDFSVEVESPIRLALAGSEMDWVEPSQNLYRSKMLRDPRSDMVYSAFHLLETEPSVQRMVVSLSSDKAVWDAVLNNEVVKELRGSIAEAASVVGESSSSKEPSDDSNGDENIMSWIVMFAKTKIMQLLDKITEIVNNLFMAQNEEKKGSSLDEKVKSSFFLSIVVVIVVVVARAKTKNGSS